MNLHSIITIKPRNFAVSLMALSVLLAGCSSSPSPSDGERAIQNRINEQSQGRIRLNRFEKTNGAQGELAGFKIYALEFEAEIEFTEDCKWVIGMYGQQLSFQTSKPVAQPRSGFSWNSFLDDTTNPGKLVRKGQQAKLSGVIRFVKKENGWAVDGVELTKADVGNTPPAGAGQHPPGGPGGDRMGKLAEDLGLSEDQKEKFGPILKEQGDQMKALREDTSLTQEDRRAKMKAIRDATSEKVKGILTPEQFTKFQELMKNRRGPGGLGGPGGPGGAPKPEAAPETKN